MIYTFLTYVVLESKNKVKPAFLFGYLKRMYRGDRHVSKNKKSLCSQKVKQEFIKNGLKYLYVGGLSLYALVNNLSIHENRVV